MYLAALALTLVVEVPLYAVALRAGWSVPWSRAVPAAVSVNLVTHPVLWLCLSAVRHSTGYPLLVVAAEALVCLTEWALLAHVVRRDRLPLAVLCVGVNAASVLAGLLLSAG